MIYLVFFLISSVMYLSISNPGMSIGNTVDYGSLNKRFLPESQIVNLWRLGRPKSYCRVMGTPMNSARCWVLRLSLVVLFISPYLSLLLLKITYCFRSVNTAIINLDEMFRLMTMCFKNRTSSFALKHLYILQNQLRRLKIKRIHSNLQI